MPDNKPKYVLFIHGIGPQEPHYSERLIQKLWPAGQPADVKCREMLYYDVFETMNAKTEMDKWAAQAAPILNNLVALVWPGAQLEPALATTLKDCVAHVLYFAASVDVRTRILNEFKKELVAILKEAPGGFARNVEITVVSHSLGTAVAYLGLHDIVKDPVLGLQKDVVVRSLYTLAAPIELVRVVGSKLPQPLAIPNLTDGVKRPTRVNASGKVETNIGNWFSFRHALDPVASLAALKGRPLLDNNDIPPFSVFDTQIAGVHDFGRYIDQARTEILSHVEVAS